jgi:purine-binding chemotaxis protein CheW
MSGIKHILTFTHNNLLFAVDSLSVREIIYLPALTPLEEAPQYITGVFNLRGKIIPVIDLNIRFGHGQKPYCINDCVIILEREDAFMGIIINDVHDVIEVPESDIEPAPTYGREDAVHPHFISGEVKVGEGIVMLIDHEAILDFGIEESLKFKAQGSKEQLSASPQDMSIFHQRAVNLMQPPESLAPAGQIPVSVVSLNNEYYGVSLDTVKEFSEVKDITPVPCTPPHIVGNMNLRGDILTLVDIRGMLNLPSAKFGIRNSELKPVAPQSSFRTPHLKAVIAQVNELVAGILVDDVLEVININPSEFRPVPSAVSDISHEFIKGEFPYNEKMLSILDLKRILTNKELIVEEEA